MRLEQADREERLFQHVERLEAIADFPTDVSSLSTLSSLESVSDAVSGLVFVSTRDMLTGIDSKLARSLQETCL